jgi:D-alanyl-D-alanine carboxypeptidase (penicillin-binding protein 5/6)
MKKFILIIFSLFFNLYSKQLDVNILSKNAILINGDNAKVLFEKNSNEKVFPASLTKVATALFTLESKKDLKTKCRVLKRAIRVVLPREKQRDYKRYPPYVLESDGSSFNLKRWEIISLKDLLYSLLLISGNDCANVIADNIGETIPSFIKSVNSYLKKIGCKNTYLYNPHGLHYPNHVTTAYDMALITKRAMEFPIFRKMVSTIFYKVPKTNKSESKKIELYNALLDRKSKYFYPKAIGVKTGYHSKAGYNLIAAAKSEDRVLIAVLMGGEKKEDRYLDAKKLFEKAFSEKKVKEVIFDKTKGFKVKVRGAKRDLVAYLKEDVIFEYYPSDEVNIKAFIKWEEFSLPIERGSKVGYLSLINENKEVVATAAIYARDEVRKSFLFRVKEFFKKFSF